VVSPGRFDGKTALVLGVANKRSIAWAIAKRLAEEGARLAFTFQGERIEKSVRDLAESVSSPLVAECDVRSDADLERVFGQVGEAFEGGLDLLVHSVAYAAAEDLEGRFTDTPRDRFWLALDISAYSLVACSRLAEPLMEARGGGSIVTMTYLGGERAVPHYNVMGVAKATLDASMRYLAWPAPSGRSPRARSRASRRWRRSWRSARRSIGTSTRTTSARPPRFSCQTTRGT
jgi:enoyl-[acyl-carrier protein] reductase I